MTDINELKSWIAHAEDDFAAAKALLILKDFDFPKTHDLPTLNTMCNERGILTGLVVQELVDLTEFAVRRRYPGNQPTLDEAKEAIEFAKSVRRFARGYLGLKK
jgi:HEPN domain-containing protein